MALPEIDQVKDAALKYDKRALAKMVQMGQLSPTIATMAAMMRDRIVQSEMKPPEQATVVEEVFKPAMPQAAGLAAVPTNPQMFQGMAGGGIVAMADGGDVPRYQGLSGSVVQNPNPVSFTGALSGERQVDKQRLRAYYLANGLPLPDELKTREELAAVRGEERGPAGSMAELIGLDRLVAPSGRINEPSLFSQFLEREKAKAMGGAPSAENPSGVGVNYAVAPNQTAAETQRLAAVSAPTAAAPAPAAKPPVRKPPAGLPAAAAAAKPTATSGLAAAQADYEKALETQRGKEPTAEGVLADINKFDKEFGVDREFFKNQAKELEAQREELKGDRKEAANMRLLEAGLSILGGTSPYAFENIGKGASKALAGFADDIKDIKKQTRDLDKARQEYALAQQNAARSDSAKAQQMLEKRADKYNSLGLELAKTRAEFAARMKELGIREEGVRVQREQLNKTPTEIQLIERYSNDPQFRKAFDAMQASKQAPKTEEALREKYAENPWLKKQYPTVEDFIRANTPGATPASTGPRGRPLSAFEGK